MTRNIILQVGFLSLIILIWSAIIGTDEGSATFAADTKTSFRSSQVQATLIELFTSQGCESCPPADIWMSELQTRKGIWTEIVPVAFHVDYWDKLGWPDQYAQPIFTKRQRVYSMRWKRSTIYTPNFVVNGKEWNGWFNMEPIRVNSNTNAGVLEVTLTGGPREFKLRYFPADEGEEWEGYVVVMGMGLLTVINKGENRGKQLMHDFVALSYLHERLNPTQDGFGATFRLPRLKAEGSEYAVAAWVTRKNEVIPVQATGGMIPKHEAASLRQQRLY